VLLIQKEVTNFDLKNSQHDNSVKDAVGLFKPRPGYLGNTQYYPLFAVDTSVYPVDVTKTNVKYFEVPFYERRLHDPLPLPPERYIFICHFSLIRLPFFLQHNTTAHFILLESLCSDIKYFKG
jgi:hypothetical protein